MNLSRRARALAVLAASASLVAVPLATPGSAAAAQPGKCTKLKTTGTTTIKATLTGCTPKSATGGKGTGTFKSKEGATAGTLNITIKWANKAGTTKGTIKFGPASGLGKCPAGTTARIKITGKVTGGTGKAVKTFKKGQKITGMVCQHPTKGIVLEPGTALKF